MHKKQGSFILIVLFACSWLLQGQSFHVQLSQPCFIVGDVLQYAVYPAKEIKADSMLIYVELYSAAGKMEMQHIHRLYSGASTGAFPLPLDLQEGVYELLCYSLWDHISKDSSIVRTHQVFFPIYNDLVDKPLAEERFDVFKLDVGSDTVHRTVLTTKSPAKLSVAVADNTSGGTFSVSILPDWMATKSLELIEHRADPHAHTQPPSGYDERKNLFLEGLIVDPFTKLPVKDKSLSLYIPSLGYFKRISAKDGRVKTTIPDIFDQRRIQVLSLNPNTRYPLVVESPQSYAPADRNRATTIHARRSPEIVQWLIQHAKKRLIEDLFENKAAGAAIIKDTVVPYRPDRRFVMTDFQELKDLEEFIKEVLLDARVTSAINARKSLRLRNKDKNELYRWPAWYLLDGIFQADEDVMLQYDIAKIKSIDLYQRDLTIEKQFDPVMKYNGIFSINTYVLEEPNLLIYPINGFYREHPFLRKASATVPSSQIPDLRAVLAWQTHLTTDQNGQLNINFYTSDIKGRYTLILSGLDQAGGYLQQAHYFKVD